jgi:transposase
MAGRPKRKADLATLNQIGAEKVEELLEQGKSIEDVWKILKVSRAALQAWLDAPEQSGLLVRARVRAADNLASETLAIVDGVAEEANAIAKARARVDARKWVAAKWDPARYGDQKGVNVNIDLGMLHLEAVKAVKPLREPDTRVIEAPAAPREGSN